MFRLILVRMGALGTSRAVIEVALARLAAAIRTGGAAAGVVRSFVVATAACSVATTAASAISGTFLASTGHG